MLASVKFVRIAKQIFAACRFTERRSRMQSCVQFCFIICAVVAFVLIEFHMYESTTHIHEQTGGNDEIIFKPKTEQKKHANAQYKHITTALVLCSVRVCACLIVL